MTINCRQCGADDCTQVSIPNATWCKCCYCDWSSAPVEISGDNNSIGAILEGVADKSHTAHVSPLGSSLKQKSVG